MSYLENTAKFRSGDRVRPYGMDWPGTVLKVVFVLGDGLCYEVTHMLQSGPVIKVWEEDQLMRCENDKKEDELYKGTGCKNEAVKA